MTTCGEAVVASSAVRSKTCRLPQNLERFLQIVTNAAWPHFTALKKTFSTADIGKRTRIVIFNIGDKYRLIAVVDFEKQSLLIEQVLTHEEYDRESL